MEVDGGGWRWVEVGGGGWRWLEVGGGRWRRVEVGGGGWRWVEVGLTMGDNDKRVIENEFGWDKSVNDEFEDV